MALEALNFFDVFVNQLGGSLLFGYLLLIALMLMICYFMKVSQTFIMFWLIIFSVAWGSIFFGPIVPMLAFIASAFYMFRGIYKLTTEER